VINAGQNVHIELVQDGNDYNQQREPESHRLASQMTKDIPVSE
jgi:hypothetical protein